MPDRPDIAEAARTLVLRIEGQPVAGAGNEEPVSGQGQQRACCNARPSSRRWDPHGIDHRPPLLVPMAGWQRSSGRQWWMGAR